MNRRLFLLVTIIYFLLSKTNAQVYCNVNVTKEKIGFGGCYNGALTINQLNVLDTSVRGHPLRFRKLNAIKLIEKTSIPNDGKKIEVYFNHQNKYFKWRIYEKVEGHDNDDLYSDFPHIDKRIVGNIFKSDTWYLFNFYNPHFRVFVYSDSNCAISYVKEKLSANL